MLPRPSLSHAFPRNLYATLGIYGRELESRLIREAQTSACSFATWADSFNLLYDRQSLRFLGTWWCDKSVNLPP